MTPKGCRFLGLLLAGATATPTDNSEIIVGSFRVQALSATLLRVEPKGPSDFEDRTTFMVQSRDFKGIPITKKSVSAEGTLLSTQYYNILVKTSAASSCDSPTSATDVNDPVRSAQYPNGAKVASRKECCDACEKDTSCSAWVHTTGSGLGEGDVPGVNCWPLSSFSSLHSSVSNREMGCSSRGCQGTTNFVVSAPNGTVLYDSSTDPNKKTNLLHWPAPLQAASYALTDYPRFFVPEWGTAPIPAGAKVDPALVATNGYDFRNNVLGDTYVFLLGSDLEAWSAARSEFVQLAGPCPVLPDFAYGTWFTWWHAYTEQEAKNDIEHWENLSLPIDVWALDMNWRQTKNNEDRYYHYPNNDLFPNYTEWFSYLKEHKLRTYFNDHPFPVASRGAGGLQTSKEEVAFRWNGLSEWMGRGLTYWWFDHNWGFSIPPPFVNTSHTSGNWEGLDNAAWGSHVYFNAVEYYDKTVRDKAGDKWYGGRPMALTKFGLPDSRPGMDPKGHAESPAQHRFPVWWTGDGVNLQASVETMVDAGLYDFKPFVHSDCGGDNRGSAGDLMRWTAHCTYGTILRFHGSDHRSWTYDDHTVDVVRSYLNARYKLIPSLISAGQRATKTGFPLAARGDLYWPEHAESRSNDQYIFLDDVLVAPIFNSTTNETSRSVWVPPGEWEDAWDGSVVTGPKTITTKQPYERQPMWHRKGGLLIVADTPATRVEEQDWSSLTLEAFPAAAAQIKSRSICERGSTDCVDVTMLTDGEGKVQFEIGETVDEAARQWVVRVHLRPNERAVAAAVDDIVVPTEGLLHLEPQDDPAYFPLAGAGTAPAPKAGFVLELRVPRSARARAVEVTIGKADLIMYV